MSEFQRELRPRIGILIVSLSLGEARRTVMSMFVCLSVCLSVARISRNHTAELHYFYARIMWRGLAVRFSRYGSGQTDRQTDK